MVLEVKYWLLELSGTGNIGRFVTGAYGYGITGAVGGGITGVVSGGSVDGVMLV